jgi:putative ABC transport system permease protein
VETLLQDMRYACRTLAKQPGFAAIVILCVALGIGVNSTIFSIVDAMIIRPLPFKSPEELVIVVRTHPADGIERDGLSYPEVQDFKERTQVFVDLAAESGRPLTLSDGDEPERLFGSLVSANLFPMLGVEPVLGRQFRPEEDRPGAPRVAILSHGLWQRRYAGDPAVLGRAITVDGHPHTVIGVMPPKFQFPETAQLWIPQAPILHTVKRGANREVWVYARLKTGTTIAAARRDVQAIAVALASEHAEDKGWGASTITLREDGAPPDVRLTLFTMMGAVTLVLLVACANVANLLLARSSVRRREMAVRAALGAGRARIVRQLLTESVVLAALSLPLGVLVAYLGVEWLTNAIPPSVQMPYYWDWRLNPRVLAYTSAVAVSAGLIFGLAPALHAARTDLQDSLKEGGRGASSSRDRLRHALVVAEISLSLVLLVGASLFVRSFLNLQKIRTGLDMAPLMTLRFFMPEDRYQADDAMNRRVEDVVRRIEALPGVASTMASGMVPLGGGGAGAGVVAEGVAVTPGEEPDVSYYGVTPHALRTLNLPLLAGRDLTDAEGAGRSGVAIVNQAFGRRLWGRDNVIGARFRLTNDKTNQWITVIGLLADFRLFAERDNTPPRYAFLSYAYAPSRSTGLTIRVAVGAPAAITGAVRAEIRASDPTMPITQVRTGEEQRVLRFWEDRLMAWMFSIFGAVALFLASVGVYGVMSYAVSQRTQEIGVRMALGASRRHVLSLILGHAGRIAAAGIVLGVIGAFGVTRIVGSLLYNVSTTDPLSFLATAVFLSLVALAASYVPARRATAVDPMIALRSE